jgi:hypothetical protein
VARRRARRLVRFFIAAAVALLASGLSLLTGESRRTRAAAPRAVSPGWSSEALSHLSRRWTRIDRVPVGGDEPVDHVLVSTAGVFAVTTRFTSSDWSTSSPALARAVAHAHEQAARIPGVSAVPVLVVWGPGAPPVPGGWELHDDVMVCRGSSDAAWRAHLEALPATVAPGQVHALVRRLTP